MADDRPIPSDTSRTPPSKPKDELDEWLLIGGVAAIGIVVAVVVLSKQGVLQIAETDPGQFLVLYSGVAPSPEQIALAMTHMSGVLQAEQQAGQLGWRWRGLRQSRNIEDQRGRVFFQYAYGYRYNHLAWMY